MKEFLRLFASQMDKIPGLCHYLIMLKKELRLTKNSAFQATYRVRNSYCVSGVVLWVGKKKSDFSQCTKVGFVVSKKTHKRAVKRNRLKRLMRESYRLLSKEKLVYGSNDYLSLIFIGYEKALGLDFAQMKDVVRNLLSKVRG